MDTKAQRRLKILTDIVGGRLTVQEGATAMALSPRHTRRLVQRFCEEGAKALVHGNRGHPPVNRLSDDRRAEILELAREEYGEFNDVHMQEALRRDHGIVVSREALRQLLRCEGRAPKRKRRPASIADRASGVPSEG